MLRIRMMYSKDVFEYLPNLNIIHSNIFSAFLQFFAAIISVKISNPSAHVRTAHARTWVHSS